MRLIVGGGRAAETLEAKGAVVLGVRTLSEGGRVGNFSREQVIHFIVLLISLFNISYHCVILFHCLCTISSSEDRFIYFWSMFQFI